MAAIAVVVVGTFYFMSTYSGPFHWLAELQLRWFGSYHEEFTFALTCATLILPVVGADKLLRRMSSTEAERAEPQDTVPARPPCRGAARTLFEVPKFAWIGFALCATGIYQWATYRGPEPLVPATAREFEQAARPASSYLELSGVPLWTAAIDFDDGHTVNSYVPLVSEQWRSPEEVAVYLVIPKSEFDERSAPPFRGIIAPSFLPGPVEVRFEGSGYVPTKSAIMFTPGGVPATTADSIRLIWGGAAMLAVSMAYYAWRRSNSVRLSETMANT